MADSTGALMPQDTTGFQPQPDDPRRVLLSLHGKTVEWTFQDGPTAGTAYVHRFNGDGSVDYRQAGARDWTRAAACACTRIGNNCHAISYLGDVGSTLTAVLNTATGHVVAFASNGSQWHQQRGTFRFVDEGTASRRGGRPSRSRRNRTP